MCDNPIILPAQLEQALNRCTSLPSLPAVAMQIIEVSKNPDISLHDVAKIISSDPAISVKLLKIANSPLYSQRRSLSNLREALTLLGFNASLTIALSFTLLDTLVKNREYENYWKRSILSASIARTLGKRLQVTALEDLFLASLLQDIGVLVFQCLDESPYQEQGSELLSHHERIQLEQEKYDFDHALLGAWLLKSWGLPDYLVRAVQYSHSLNQSIPEQRKNDQYFHYCLNLSGNMADIWLSNQPAEPLRSVLDVAKNVLEMDDAEFNQLIVDIDGTVPEIASMFDVELVSEKDRQYVIDEARELLLERSVASIKQSEDDRHYIESITNRVEQIEKASRLDHLTRVYNRQHIEQLLEVEFAESNLNHWPLSLAFIDVDNFKDINDTYGHLAGDEMLKMIAEFFSANIRETDILARYGGDEFLLMLPGSTSDIAQTVLQRLLTLLKEKVLLPVKGKQLSVSVSLGLATHQDRHHFSSLKEFLTATDEALYQAKHQGKNCLAVY